MTLSSSLFYPSHDATGSGLTPRLSFWLLTTALLVLAALSYLTVYLDHPFLTATNSRALYVDEGFYSDGAQNFAKFGHWWFPYDFPHWAGAPFLTFIQSLVFPVFGANLETARLLSTVFGLVAGFAFYGIARMSMQPVAALLLTITGMLTINYVAHARSALVDPTAVCLALLALLVFVRVRNKPLAVMMSIGLAFAAFLTKMYFLFTLGAVVALWMLELVLVPALSRKSLEKGPVLILGACLAAIAVVFASYLYVYGVHVSDYYIINSDKIPWLDFSFLVNSFIGSIKQLPYNTKTHVYLLIILLTPVCVFALLLWPHTRARMITGFKQPGRGELAVGLWLLMGLVTIGVLNIPKPHYHFFAILPLCFIGAVGLKLVFPGHLHTIVIAAAAALHLAYQAPLYYEWSQREQRTAIVDASREAARVIEQDTNEAMIPVAGEYSAELGLFSDRIFSLDVKWAPSYHYCRRIEYWKPRFHVNIVWPGSISRQETESIEACDIVANTTEIARFPVFKPLNDELVLSRIHYE